ncbi:ATP-binding cassette transporter [Mycena indigotica]|uniref:ATP-binding cassette transporter n=1 Tax=Mycena indigotica TaxID=2126181 RepID=A0A8H6TFX6_9AGAR|nr:ATP-binding cassette transporter [Mycena indigotica]KAF7315025.1 ATP-binding cassette transporter [Mycena indigotica]
MKSGAEADIARQVDVLVAAQVAELLKVHMPEELQVEVARQEEWLEEVQRDLRTVCVFMADRHHFLSCFNAARTGGANAMLRDGESAPLQPIYKMDGTVADKFPSTLKELFEMDVSTSQELMREYELSECSASRERNLNRLMQFFNVKYQLAGAVGS